MRHFVAFIAHGRIRIVIFDEPWRGVGIQMFNEEGPAIARWMMDGAKLYLKEGLDDVPAAITAITDEYLDDNDDLGRFISDCLIPTDDKNDIKVATLSMILRHWASKAEIKIKTGKLGIDLSDRGYRVSRTEGAKWLRGFRLTGYGEKMHEQVKAELDAKNATAD